MFGEEKIAGNFRLAERCKTSSATAATSGTTKSEMPENA